MTLLFMTFISERFDFNIADNALTNLDVDKILLNRDLAIERDSILKLRNIF